MHEHVAEGNYKVQLGFLLHLILTQVAQISTLSAPILAHAPQICIQAALILTETAPILTRATSISVQGAPILTEVALTLMQAAPKFSRQISKKYFCRILIATVTINFAVRKKMRQLYKSKCYKNIQNLKYVNIVLPSSSKYKELISGGSIPFVSTL